MITIKDYLFARPMLLSAILTVITVILGYYFKAALIIMALLFILLLFFVILKKPNSALAVALIFPVLISISTLNTLNKTEKASLLNGSETNAVFTVTNITYESENYFVSTVNIKESDVLNKGDNLTFFYYKNNLEIGDTLQAKLKLKSVDNDYKLSSLSNNIYLTASASEYTVIKESFILKQVNKLRNYIKRTLFSNMEYEQAATMSALTFSEDKYFSAQFKNNVKAAGVNHIMVISGMHLSIIVTLAAFLTEKLFYNRFVKAFLILLSVLLMSFLCGFTMSILRAGVTYILYAIALLIKRKPVGENCLGAALCIIMLFSPLSIFNVAFQLSVLSTFGVLGVAIPCCRFLYDTKLLKSGFINTIISAIIVCLCATVMVIPVIIYIYGSVSAFGVITTLLISYPVTVAIWFTVIGLIVNPVFKPFAAILFCLCNWVIKYVNYVINTIGTHPHALIPTPKSMAVIACGIIILIFYLMLACKKRMDMLKLNVMLQKIINEGGKSIKWQQSQNKS